MRSTFQADGGEDDAVGGADGQVSAGTDAGDPVAQAALLFLRRPSDWPARLDDLAVRLERGDAHREGDGQQGVEADDVISADRIARLTDQLHAERSQTRAVRDQAKADIADLKAANTALRRTLKITRDRLAAAERDRDAQSARLRLLLDTIRSRLVTALGGLAGRTGVETTVVFDRADLLSVPTVPSSRGVRVRFSPAGVTAGDVIREIVDAEPSGRVLVVVTSDAEIVAEVRRAGATPVPSAALLRLLNSR